MSAVFKLMDRLPFVWSSYPGALVAVEHLLVLFAGHAAQCSLSGHSNITESHDQQFVWHDTAPTLVLVRTLLN